jgi:hypothetical protein
VKAFAPRDNSHDAQSQNRMTLSTPFAFLLLLALQTNEMLVLAYWFDPSFDSNQEQLAVEEQPHKNNEPYVTIEYHEPELATCFELCRLPSRYDTLQAALADSVSVRYNHLQAEMRATVARGGKLPVDCYAARNSELFLNVTRAAGEACGAYEQVFPRATYALHFATADNLCVVSARYASATKKSCDEVVSELGEWISVPY